MTWITGELFITVIHLMLGFVRNNNPLTERLGSSQVHTRAICSEIYRNVLPAVRTSGHKVLFHSRIQNFVSWLIFEKCAPVKHILWKNTKWPLNVFWHVTGNCSLLKALNVKFVCGSVIKTYTIRERTNRGVVFQTVIFSPKLSIPHISFVQTNNKSKTQSDGQSDNKLDNSWW
jgi:hypothetical protein